MSAAVSLKGTIGRWSDETKPLYETGDAGGYRPFAIVSTTALGRLAKKRLTWAEILADGRGVAWWREQVFAMEWAGLARWEDTASSKSRINKAGCLGTWGLTPFGVHYFAKQS